VTGTTEPEKAAPGKAVPQGLPERVSISSLIFSADLYPRQKIDEDNIRSLRSARNAGETLPPIIACRTTRIILDGVHRWTEAKQQGDDDILVIWETCRTDAERFLRAVQLNSRHGLRLNALDRVRVAGMAEKVSLTAAQIAGAMALNPTELRRLRPPPGADGESLRRNGGLPQAGGGRAQKGAPGPHASPGVAAAKQASRLAITLLTSARQLLRAFQRGLMPSAEAAPALHAALTELHALLGQFLSGETAPAAGENADGGQDDTSREEPGSETAAS
jgi:ParB-like chromosome segregation protein Spo0J